MIGGSTKISDSEDLEAWAYDNYGTPLTMKIRGKNFKFIYIYYIRCSDNFIV